MKNKQHHTNSLRNSWKALALSCLLALVPSTPWAEDAGESLFSRDSSVRQQLRALGQDVQQRFAPIREANPWMDHFSPRLNGKKASLRSSLADVPNASFNASVKKWWRGNGDPDVHVALQPRGDMDIRLGVGSQRGVGNEQYLRFRWSFDVGTDAFRNPQDRSISYYQERRRLLESLRSE